jgi:outer membrane autotransporter protein
MKKLIVFCLSLAAFTSANAQFEQGRILAGGNGSLSIVTDKNKTGNTTVVTGTTVSFGLTPQFGYFIMDNLAVGAELQFGVSSFNPKDDNAFSKSSSVSTLIGPFARYYFDPGVFVQGGFGLGSQSSKFTSGGGTTTDTKFVTSRVNLGVGYALFLNDNVAVEPMISYQSRILREVDSDPVAKDVDNGVYISVGFQVYLSK